MRIWNLVSLATLVFVTACNNTNDGSAEEKDTETTDAADDSEVLQDTESDTQTGTSALPDSDSDTDTGSGFDLSVDTATFEEPDTDTSSVDNDSDGVPDVDDNCPFDDQKLEAGLCGCGQEDGDRDSDGALNCFELCPDDPNKLDPGVCGCDQDEFDADSDSLPDCADECPSSPLKHVPGFCGCDFDEYDDDTDGMPDCVDDCPSDPDKISAGICGCGYSEQNIDSDTFPDCIDDCLYIFDDGQDTDSDGRPDACDNCPNHANSAQTDGDLVEVAFVNPPFSESTDCIEADVCMTRYTSGAVVNKHEPVVSWACGWCGAGTEFETDLRSLKLSCFGTSMSDILHKRTCLYIEQSDSYWDIFWTQWSSGGGGGGFAYIRSQGDYLGDACDNCATLINTDQWDSDSSCPSLPFVGESSCGDACQ